MIDCLLEHRAAAECCPVLENLGLEAGAYVVVTLHRPSNVDDERVLGEILTALEYIQNRLPMVFPVHPRTLKNLSRSGLEPRIEAMANLRLLEPLGYLEFLKLISSARAVLTDSGGIQEETTVLHVPCLTLRENTERPVTCQAGTNQLVGSDPARIIAAFNGIMSGPARNGSIPPLWDGKAAKRIAEKICLQPW